MTTAAAVPQPSTLPLLLREHPSFTRLLSPRSIAVVGAGDAQGIGRAVLANVLAGGFAGSVIPIDPDRPSLLGIRTAPSVTACPRPLDLVVSAAPRAELPALIGECVRAGVKGLILCPEGLGSAPGPHIPSDVLRAARATGMRIFGPDSLGVMNPHALLNATFATAMAKPGPLALIGQSGGLVSALVEQGGREGIGFSGVVALGGMADVGWSDLIDHFGDDPHTKAILLCIEDIGDPGAFLSAVREVSATKPVVAIKAARADCPGQPPIAQRVFGNDEVIDALFARAGILRVEGFTDLFGIANLLATQPRPAGRRLAIVSCTQGVGQIAAEAAVRGGGQVALPVPARGKSQGAVAATGAQQQSLVQLVDRGGSGLAQAAAEALADANCDGVLVVLTPSGVAHPTGVAAQLAELPRAHAKPLLASWMGGASMDAGRKRLVRAGIPVFAYPDLAARAWNALGRHRDLIIALYETPVPAEDEGRLAPDRDAARTIIARSVAEDRLDLSDQDALLLMQTYRLPAAIPAIATTHDEAIAQAAQNGYPVEVESWPVASAAMAAAATRFIVEDDESLRTAFHAIRDLSQALRGSQAFAGVAVRPAAPARGARRLAVALAVDAHLGQVIGIEEFVAASGRVGWTCGLPPLTGTLARHLLIRAGIGDAVSAVAGSSPLERLLVGFSRLVIEQRRVKSAELDVLVTHGGEPVILKARIALHGRELIDDQLPRSVIRPYPVEYRSQDTLADGTVIELRPIVPADEPALSLMHRELSEGSVHHRYFADLPLKQRIAHPRLARICHADYARQIALIVEQSIPGVGKEMIAVGRLNRVRDAHDAELALLVADRWQRRGIGERLLLALIAVARSEGISRIVAEFLADNHGMRHLCMRKGFDIHHGSDDQRAHASLTLS